MLIRTTVIAACALAIAAPAFAQTAPSNSNGLSLAQVEQRLAAQGYRVLEIERDDGEFEVNAFDSQNRCRELHVNLRTGEIRRDQADDDCYEDDHRRRGDDRR